VRRLRNRLLLTGLVVLHAAAVDATDYQIASAESHADFAVRLLWMHTIEGRFTDIVGRVHIDSRGMATVNASIRADSIVMDSDRFRRWTLAPEFFDAAHYPLIHFVSRPVAVAMLSRGGPLDGQLDLRGMSRPVRFDLQPARCQSLASAACVIRAEGTISRSAFGMHGHHVSLSDPVQLGLSIQLKAASD
jgi:polyisoprenoid-binding protein YceI